MVIPKIFPNPFDKDSKLSDLTKRSILLKEFLGFATIQRNIISLLIISIFLVVYLKIPIIIVSILIGTEILVNLIMGYVKIKKLKSIYNIKAQDNARSYRKILIINEYYELIKSLFGVIASIISVSLIFIFFSKELSSSVISALPKAGLLKYFIPVIVIFRLFEFIMRLIRYSRIKNLKESDDLAKVNQEYTLIAKNLELIRFVPGMSVILLFLFLIGLPVYITVFFAGLTLLFILLSIIEIKRIKKINLDNKNIDPSVLQHKIEKYKNEQIAGSIFGIIKTAVSFKDALNPFGSSFLGSGKMYYPENTLVVTNCRLLFVQIPLSGGNKVIGNTEYVSQNFFFNRGELRQKGEQIIKTNSLSEILSLATNDVIYNDIKTLTLKPFKIIIEKSNGGKLAYTFMDKEYTDLLKRMFKFYLKDRFIEK